MKKEHDWRDRIVILDNNELSLMAYAEEYPENWKKICEALDKKKDSPTNEVKKQ